jgi:hypothetical protein
MSTNNNAPFYVWQRVVVMDDSPGYGDPETVPTFKKDEIVAVLEINDKGNIRVEANRKLYWNPIRFAPINPYSTSATQELIKSINIGDTADQPVKEIIQT